MCARRVLGPLVTRVTATASKTQHRSITARTCVTAFQASALLATANLSAIFKAWVFLEYHVNGSIQYDLSELTFHSTQRDSEHGSGDPSKLAVVQSLCTAEQYSSKDTTHISHAYSSSSVTHAFYAFQQ